MCNNRSRDVLSVVVSRIPYKFQGLDSQSFYVDNVTTCRSLFLLAGITKRNIPACSRTTAFLPGKGDSGGWVRECTALNPLRILKKIAES